MAAEDTTTISSSKSSTFSVRGIILESEDITLSDARVGNGRLGTVLRGTWLEQPVAIKRVLPSSEQRSNPGARERLEHELSILLPHHAHPNILPLYGLHVGPDFTLYLVYKLGRGSLKDSLRIVRGKGLVLSELFRIAIGVASALAYLHSHGIVYRELKPGSVIIGDDGGPMLDPEFGVVREILQIITQMQRLTAQKSVSGCMFSFFFSFFFFTLHISNTNVSIHYIFTSYHFFSQLLLLFFLSFPFFFFHY